MDENRERLIREICLSEGEEGDVARSLGDRLAASELPADERAALEQGAHRLLLYRRLVRGNLEGAARRLLPRAAAWLDRDDAGGFGREFGAFLAETGTRTHHLRDIGAEFVRWGAPRWASAERAPSHLADLARYEVLEFDVAIAAPASARPTGAELALDRGVVFEPTTHLAVFAYAVHEDSEDPSIASGELPAARPTALLIFRDAEHAVHTREVAVAVAPVLERLLAGESLESAVRAASGNANAAGPVDDALLAQVAEVLAALASEGVLLGAAAAP